MSFPGFLADLYDSGRVTVAEFRELSEREREQGDEVLADRERDVRLEMSGDAPEFSPQVARWAAIRMYRACQFLCFRALGEAVIQETFAESTPPDEPAAAVYSVDLTYRFLPDLIRYARSASEQDPLLTRLKEWAANWPLSSLGLASVEPSREALDTIVASPSLLQLYVDRILAAEDVSRLEDPRVRSAVGRSLGMHAQLAPRVAKALARSGQASVEVPNESVSDTSGDQ